jgi:hypothetical protein
LKPREKWERFKSDLAEKTIVGVGNIVVVAEVYLDDVEIDGEGNIPDEIENHEVKAFVIIGPFLYIIC